MILSSVVVVVIVVFCFVSLMAGCSCGGGLAAALLLPDSTERSPSESDGLPWMESQAADWYLHCTEEFLSEGEGSGAIE